MFILSVLVKILTLVLKIFKKGDGTALPGLFVEKLFPNILQRLLRKVPHKIVITGTNGKTTTQTILKSILLSANKHVITNSAGANLKRGIISALLKNTNIFGQIKASIVVLEVEEGTLPQIVTQIDPEIIVVTNLYRDQLDAYGEVDVTEKYIKSAIQKAPRAKLVLNSDDPRVSNLANGFKNEVYFVSLPNDFKLGLPYEGVMEEHANQGNLTSATDISITNQLNVQFSINSNSFALRNIELQTLGFFHVYNALFASVVAKLLDIETQSIENGIKNFKPAFGRGETTKSRNGLFTYKLLLVKNPAGLTLNLDLLKHTSKINLALFLNDNTADGKDVSWIWDADFELMNNLNISNIFLGGTRAHDLAVRIKYAIENQFNEVIVDTDIAMLIDQIENKIVPGETVFVLPTYTALLEFRKQLGLNLE